MNDRASVTGSPDGYLWRIAMRTATLSLPEANPASAPASTTLAPIIGTAAADADSAHKADQKSAKAETAAIASLADALASGADAESHRDTLEIIPGS